ncbi:uncharacterized protein LOC112511256 [Cynara cardunculus var. scolymus]|uniref:Uncharacterized protein n=1 Tax=Cynara cardunculus var. scolymus TaxID=59895 RepID=A0A118JYJ7_CYNCS|nr:uncharacterized protein LOC112511256 [Cynara cardunculus var. scolymus]KVH98067.1 hypothetical protein Ccrd_023718 [Cynara cardunculus var. scolymus]
MTDDDNWVKSAMDDDHLVVQILLTLRQQSLPSQSNIKSPPLGWSIRQRRSRPQVVLLPSVAKKSPPAARASPTTPLSWSGATSVSGGGNGNGNGNGDGIEESSRLIPNRSDVSRSKVIRPNETTPTKRPRKKKTLAELKEDETTLLKERKQLKRQLASLQATCQQQRMENESLKKMKMDLQCDVEGLKAEAIGSFAVPDLNIPVAGDEE